MLTLSATQKEVMQDGFSSVVVKQQLADSGKACCRTVLYTAIGPHHLKLSEAAPVVQGPAYHWSKCTLQIQALGR